MPYEFYLGIDALEQDDGTEYTTALIEKRQNEGDPEYVLHALGRYNEEGAGDVVESVLNQISGDPYVGRTVGVANISSDAGDDLRREFDDRGFSTIAVTLTGGDTSAEQGRPLSFGDGGVHVSEHEIVSTIEGLYRSGRFDTSTVPSDEPTALVQGLEDYHVSSGEAGAALDDIDARASRSAKNSTLVLAAGTAIWLAEQQSFDPTEHLAGDPPPVRKAKREMRPDTT